MKTNNNKNLSLESIDENWIEDNLKISILNNQWIKIADDQYFISSIKNIRVSRDQYGYEKARIMTYNDRDKVKGEFLCSIHDGAPLLSILLSLFSLVVIYNLVTAGFVNKTGFIILFSTIFSWLISFVAKSMDNKNTLSSVIINLEGVGDQILISFYQESYLDDDAEEACKIIQSKLTKMISRDLERDYP